ncbi:hypothetical protein Q7C36_010097 [Tachysurus vachellii]|uniref:Uncharacterized protein n=1 Tax=Tachysurus vachellii TaxID=175792 RepID=A0AA88STY9_TACVA|nr:hypothetical protein Q7C36_010097 [Tachysurus vachellii]
MDAAQTKVIHQQHRADDPDRCDATGQGQYGVGKFLDRWRSVTETPDAVNKGSHLGELEGWPQLWQLSESAAAKPVRLLFLFPTSTSSGDPLVRHIGIELLAWSLITATLAEQRGQ